MKVLHLTLSEAHDSASRAARRLHEGLIRCGADSRMRVPSANPVNEPADAGLFRIVQSYVFDSNEWDAAASAFHVGYPGVPLPTDLLGCDVIHLHQVAGFLSPLAIRELLALGKPVVWSLPDAGPFTGGCFQPAGCDGFRDGCKCCPQLRDDATHLPAALLEDKRTLLGGAENLTLIVPNAWMAESIRCSAVFRGLRVETIAPTFAGESPQHPGGGEERPLQCVFAFESPGSEVRSARTLAALLQAAQTYGGFRSLVRGGKVSLAVWGLSPFEMPGIDLPVRFVDRDELNPEADLFILPRVDENRVAAILEARARGIPVLAFDQAGISECITHKTNGWLVQPLDLLHFAEALCYLAAHPTLVLEMARSQAQTSESDSAQTLRLYETLLREKRAPHASQAATPGDARPELRAQCDQVVRAIAQRFLEQPRIEEVQAECEAAKRQLRGTEDLLGMAQRDLAKIEEKQQKLLKARALPASLKEPLQKIQKSVANLRGTLKWRGRRLRVFSASGQNPPAPTVADSADTPPEIALWARAVHSLFLKRHWMKHGKKDQYPPRPMQAEQFPTPKLPEDKLPRMAIVTPSFMQADYLDETLRSVLDQDYPKLAYAVHDGGSTDGTLDIIKRHADRITVWASHPDSGQSRAIASGFEKISGDVMGWVNSDDLFVRGALRFVGEYFATHPKVDVIYGNRIIINEHSQEIARWVLPPHNPRILPYLDPVPQETLFWRASIWEKVGGIDPSFRFALDWDLVARFQAAGAKIVHLPYFLGCFRVHSQQKLSVRAENIGAEETAFIRRRATGHDVTFDELAPYKRWMEVYGSIYSRLLEWGIRAG